MSVLNNHEYTKECEDKLSLIWERIKEKGGSAGGVQIVYRKIYAGILLGRVHEVTEGSIDDVRGGFRVGVGCVD